MKVLDIIALILVIIGAINWGLIGLFNFNLVATGVQIQLASRDPYKVVTSATAMEGPILLGSSIS